MNKSPLNFLVALAISGILWTIFGVFLITSLTENPSLAEKTPEDLAFELRLFFGIVTFSSLICIFYWFVVGASSSIASKLDKAKSQWVILLFILIGVAFTNFGFFYRLNMKEGIEASYLGIYLSVLFVLGPILFWGITFAISPRNVKYLPWGK